MTKITLNTTLTKGKYKNKPLKTMVDEGWWAFKNWYTRYPNMFDADVHRYSEEINQAIKRNNPYLK